MPKDEDPKKVDDKPNIVKKPRVKKPIVAAAAADKPVAAAAKPKGIKSTVIKPNAVAAVDKAKPIAKPKADDKPTAPKPVQKKRNIPKRVKDLSWEKWVGKDVATHACLCCEKTEIRMNSFHCGHVLAEADGGLTEPDNLRPICADCNLSMGRENFNDFKARCGFNKKPRKVGAARKKKTSAKDDIENKKIINLLINYMEKKL
jgi:hypothetical protein